MDAIEILSRVKQDKLVTAKEFEFVETELQILKLIKTEVEESNIGRVEVTQNLFGVATMISSVRCYMVNINRYKTILGEELPVYGNQSK